MGAPHGARLTFDSFIEELVDESKAQTYSGLVQLSGLADEEAAKLDAAWGGISSERKRGLLEKLIELGEEKRRARLQPCVHAVATGRGRGRPAEGGTGAVGERRSHAYRAARRHAAETTPRWRSGARRPCPWASSRPGRRKAS